MLVLSENTPSAVCSCLVLQKTYAFLLQETSFTMRYRSSQNNSEFSVEFLYDMTFPQSWIDIELRSMFVHKKESTNMGLFTSTEPLQKIHHILGLDFTQTFIPFFEFQTSADNKMIKLNVVKELECRWLYVNSYISDELFWESVINLPKNLTQNYLLALPGEYNAITVTALSKGEDTSEFSFGNKSYSMLQTYLDTQSFRDISLTKHNVNVSMNIKWIQEKKQDLFQYLYQEPSTCPLDDQLSIKHLFGWCRQFQSHSQKDFLYRFFGRKYFHVSGDVNSTLHLKSELFFFLSIF